MNFSGVDLENYRFGAEKGKYKIVFDSDAVSLGGNGKFKKRAYSTKNLPSHGKKQSLCIDIARLSFVYLLKTE